MTTPAVPGQVQSLLSPGEDVLFFKKGGFLGGAHHVLTDRRILEIHRGEKIDELEYLDPGERVEAFQIEDTGVYESKQQEGGRYIRASGNVLLLTDQRVLVAGVGQRLGSRGVLWDVPLSKIRHLTIGLSPSTILDHAEIQLWMSATPETYKPGSLIAAFFVDHDPVRFKPRRREADYRASLEFFPRRICDQAGLAFSPPERLYERIGSDEEPDSQRGAAVEFYVKTDLKWPPKCVACGNPPGHEPGRIKLRRSPFKYGGLCDLDLEPPLCSRCISERSWRSAVKEVAQFNGVTTRLWFRSEQYVADFITVNSESSPRLSA